MESSSSFAAPAMPYFCDASELPGPLPTRHEIEAESTPLPCLYSRDEKRVVLVRGLFVVKFGLPLYMADGNEGYALMLLRQGGIPNIPKLYAMYWYDWDDEDDENRLFLIMEYLPGRSLKSIWPDMSDDEKTDVGQQLSDLFARLRALPAPPHRRLVGATCPLSPDKPVMFANIAGGPIQHDLFKPLDEDGNPAISGPFADETAFHDAMALRLQEQDASAFRPAIQKKDPGQPYWPSEFIRRHLDSFMGHHACVLTHGDLQRKNVLVVVRDNAPPVHQEQGKDHGKAKDEAMRDDDEAEEPSLHTPSRRLVVSGLVDWEDAGWMPSYWEYAAMFIETDWHNDWWRRYEAITGVWPKEALMLRFVRETLYGH